MENQKARRVFSRRNWVPAMGPLMARPPRVPHAARLPVRKETVVGPKIKE